MYPYVCELGWRGVWSTKAINICMPIPKKNTKKSCTITENAFYCDEMSSGNDGPRSASLGCATVHKVQTEVINHTKTDFVQKQKPACATQHLVTLQNIFSRSVHTDIL